MFSIVNVFQYPNFDDPEKKRLAGLLAQVLWGFQLIISVGVIAVMLFVPENISRWISIFVVFNGLIIIEHLLNIKGYYYFASYLFVGSFLAILFVLAWSANGLFSPAVIAMPIVVLLASFLLGKKASLYTAFIAIAGELFLLYAAYIGWLPQSSVHQTHFSVAINSIMWLLILLVLQNLYWDSLTNALSRAITENYKRKLLEVDLIKSESFRRKIFEQSNLPTLIIDGDTNLIVDGNNAALDALKLSSVSELKGHTILDYSASLQYDGISSLEKFNSYIGDAKQNDSYKFDWRNRNNDGTFWDSEAHLTAFSNDGKLLLQLVLLDVSEKKQINRAFYKLSNDFASYTGQEFFEAVSRYISLENGLDYVYVGEYNHHEGAISLLGGFALGSRMENFSYEIKNTPCCNVMDSQACIFPKGVQNLFPKDHLLQELGIIGYVGIPIYGEDNKPVGIFVTLSLQPIENSDKILNFLNLFAERITSEFKRFKTHNQLIAEVEYSRLLEKELRENQSRLQTISDNFKEGLIYQVSVMPDGIRRFTFMSQSFYDIFGISIEDGMKDSSLIYGRVFEDDIEGFSNAEKLALKQMSSFTYEARFYNKNKEKIWMSLVSTPKVMENGVVSWDGVAQVITKRKEAEEALRNSQERFKSLIKYSPFPMTLTTITGEFVIVNDEFLKVVGLVEDEVIGKTTQQLGYSIDQEATDAIYKLKSLYENIDNLEIQLENASGKSYIFLLSARTIEWNNAIYIINSLVNITDKKRMERELTDYRNNLELLVDQRTRELDKSNHSVQHTNLLLSKEREELSHVLNKLNNTQEKLIQAEKFASLGVLASGIAHEINNPLNFINGGILGIETILVENDSILKDEMKPFIDAINIGVDRASKIVKGLNHYSQKDEDLMTVCDLNTIMENCITIINGQIRSEIELRYSYAQEACLVIGNEGKLHKAILVVISNAEQAIVHKGTIQLKTDVTEDNILISIEDNGIGISEENLKRLYDPFFTTK